ncbi:MAG: DUF6159 family protein [Acidimicrobiia bacterium]|nr:DUF6159 family protein [Acidimicrobiia bacterium]
MGRIATTIELAKASWQVLKADKELVVLPILSGVASIIVAMSFLIPAGFLQGSESVGTVEYILLAALYLALAFVTIFFNTALVYAANERLSGGDPTIGSAIAGASKHLPQIFVWAAISATVSVILKSLQERAGILGQIVIGIVGLAWTLVTFLVIPVYVVENVGVKEALTRSGNLFKKTWGENVAAQVGFGLLGFLAAIPFVLLAALALSSGTEAVAAIGIIVAVVGIVAVSVILSALNAIFQTALYHYASSGAVPGDYFDNDNFAHAFVPKRR